MRLQFDKRDDTPIYRQIAQSILAQIQSGELKPGDKLPTVRSLFHLTGVSEGTIRHAYDQLAREGVLVLSQGRGTFVAEESAPGREVRAMARIDEMMDDLTALGFSAREIRLFLDVKLKGREDETFLTPVAFVDCCPESLNEAAGQLAELPGIELTGYLLEDVRRAPTELLKDFPLIITTQTHAHELSGLLPDQGRRLSRVVLSPSARTVAALARTEAGGGAGIFCKTQRFADIVKGGLRMFPHLRPSEVRVLRPDSGQSLADFMTGLSVVIVSPDYLSYATPEDRQALTAFSESGGAVIPYHHQIDKGSYMYVEERIAALGKG